MRASTCPAHSRVGWTSRPWLRRAHASRRWRRTHEQRSRTEFGAQDVFFERYAEMRYRGQRHNIKTLITGAGDSAAISEAFHRDYKRRYGHADARAAVEIQALHLSALRAPQATGPVEVAAPRTRAARPRLSRKFTSQAPACARRTSTSATRLPTGFNATGPALIEEYGSTTLVWPGDRFEVGPLREIRIHCRAEGVTRMSAAPELDPVTLEVIRYGLVSICNQIDANIKRTAFSPYIYEYNDFAVGLAGADGQLIAQNTGGMPPFVADSVGMAVRDGLEIYGARSACITATSCCAITPRCRASTSTTP